MKKVFLIALFLFEFLYSDMIFAGTVYEKVNVGLNNSGYAPFHILPEQIGDKVIKGIVIDLLNEFQGQYPYYKIAFNKVVPTARAEIELDKGIADITYDSPIFVGEKANNFIWSESFAETRDCVVMLKDSQFLFEKAEDLFGKKVGKIRGYGYGEYDQYFKEGKITFWNTDKAIQLIGMLKMKRLDCFLGNIHTTPYEIKLSQYRLEDFYFSEKPLYTFELKFQINKSKVKLKEDLDRFIIEAKATGLLKRIEERYK
ncbi:MAG: transporter substrate-binding domain-containing protein [Desulfamplus sp.]|nr:transporter substrate-binding domain-containing protein [Desulfamplus sp.]